MRGIRVVPEFDMPGHVTSWVVGYPELASAPGPYTIARGFGVFDAAFDPTRESTYKFIDNFIGEMVEDLSRPVLAHRRRREQRQAVGGAIRRSRRS